MARPLVAAINLSALAHNLQQVAEQCPNTQLCAIVKANAYGHGATQVAHYLQEICSKQVHSLGVCSIDEALVLRQANITLPIVLLEGVFHQEEIAIAREQCLSLVVHTHWQVEALLKHWRLQDPPLWIKLNSGMHRLGWPMADCAQAIDRLRAAGFSLVLMSHYASADTDNTQTQQQHQQVLQCNQTYRLPTSLGNSAAIMYHATIIGDIARPGIMLYGATPDNSDAQQAGLQPVMCLRSHIIAINDIGAGESVGYGGTWCATTHSRIAIVACGYADGYPRELHQQAYVDIEGQQCPLVGRVSMDMLAVNIDQCPQAKIGSAVTIWGDNPRINQVAQWHKSIAYTLLARINQRIPRNYTGDHL